MKNKCAVFVQFEENQKYALENVGVTKKRKPLCIKGFRFSKSMIPTGFEPATSTLSRGIGEDNELFSA
ncbi:hypothetical protein [Bacillus sp. 165]|uniref:hypothetical protein n=1 Tax=Bacillus sp. 165 TaxID=1529117 RepID=UPI001ADD4421|nr:hypothetical protein [Bacillus sp. 165]MBO9128545.1 hypothetical protein [Bacillus sp. 165]